MLDQLRKDLIEHTLKAHTAKVFDTESFANELSGTLLTSSSFKVPTETFIRSKTDSTITEEETVAAKVSKIENINAIESYNEVIGPS